MRFDKTTALGFMIGYGIVSLITLPYNYDYLCYEKLLSLIVMVAGSIIMGFVFGGSK